MTASLGWLGTGRMGSAIVGGLLDAGSPGPWSTSVSRSRPGW